ncbi:MAG: GNAT family N-acetyltransferase [Euryarchaeota archaeon]|nr:GNAT family N-acetyltransferase [Euryarchaeota archaeon]MCG2737369.1 GNAT family N-acetyltransferase [Candidatus Methanoperedenaceae archaeon]
MKIRVIRVIRVRFRTKPMDIDIRKATQADIRDIKKLLSFYALDTEKVEKNLPEFIIAVKDGITVGCACLDVGDIVELRSIAVLPSYRNQGIGSALVKVVLNRAAEITDKVYLRTTSPVFFEKKGAHRLQNDEKKVIWKECDECDKFNICKQAMMRFDI